MTWHRSWGCRLLLGHLEDQPIAHPGLEALQGTKCYRNIKFVSLIISLYESPHYVWDVSPSTRSHWSAASGSAGWPGRWHWTVADWLPAQNMPKSQLNNVQHKEWSIIRMLRTIYLHEVHQLFLHTDNSGVLQFLVGDKESNNSDEIYIDFVIFK